MRAYSYSIPDRVESRPSRHAQWAIAILAVYGFVIGTVAALTRIWP